MTRETKLGLMMVTLLAGVFGFLVYTKLHQQTVAVAGVADTASTTEATTDLHPLEAPAEFDELANSGAPASDDPFATPEVVAAPAPTNSSSSIASRFSSRATVVPTRETAASQIADRIEDQPFAAPSQPAGPASLKSSAPRTSSPDFAAELSTEESSDLQAPASNPMNADPFEELVAGGSPTAPTTEPQHAPANASARADRNSTASSFGTGSEGDAADPFATLDEPATTSSAASTVPSSPSSSRQPTPGNVASSDDPFASDEFAGTASGTRHDEFLPPTGATASPVAAQVPPSMERAAAGAAMSAANNFGEPAASSATLAQGGTAEQDPFALEDETAAAVEPAGSGAARSVTRAEVAPAEDDFGMATNDEFSAPVVTTQPSSGGTTPQRHTADAAIPAPAERLGEFDVVDLNQIRPASARPSTGTGGSTAIATLPTRGGTYTVRPSDTFWSISRQIYGTGKYFQALARHNAGVIADPQKMKPGVQIATPPATLLEQQYAALIPAAPAKAEVANAIARTAGSTVSSRTPEFDGFFLSDQGQPMYRVADQDTLSSIALSHLGRSSRWVQILELNRDILKDGNSLTIGTVLKLPADASQVRVVSGER